jgi:hypothetical protein
MNFEACLNLPRDPREAALIADSLDALARALREWPHEAWLKLAEQESDKSVGLFQRLAVRTAEAELDPRQRTHARHSAEAVASVLRVLWPGADAAPKVVATRATPPELAAT